MKAIHYDTEGDILTVTFSEANALSQRGIELSDNIVLYYDAATDEPLSLILLSYQAMLRESAQHPILLDGLERAPKPIQKRIQTILHRTPLTTFLEITDVANGTATTSQLHEIFTPAALEFITV